MSHTIQIFHHFFQTKQSAPDTLDLENFNIDNMNENFVVSRDLEGNIISRYKDDTWNFEPYKSNPSQHAIFYFKHNIPKGQIKTVKHLMLLLLIYGEGKHGSQYSVETLKHYFISLFKPLSLFATEQEKNVKQCLEDKRLLINYIDRKISNRGKTALLLSFLSLLHYNDNQQTKINYQYHDEIIQKLQTNFYRQLHQTSVIPIRILSESLSQRWKQIEELEREIKSIKTFLYHFLNSAHFASPKYFLDKSLNFKDATKKYKLEKIFSKYNINTRRDFLKFIIDIQGTSAHLIHAYTGMRRGEVLSLRNHCIESISKSSICYIVSNTSKLSGKNEIVKWVTIKEIKRVIAILNSLNEAATKEYRKKDSDFPLFIWFFALLGENSSRKIVAKKKFYKEAALPLDNTKLTITQEDKKQIEPLTYLGNIEEIVIGEIWHFKSHQYRRSLAIYSLQSGLVSLGTLQKQLKHIFREMTLYYANGASFARKIFDIPQKHIANDFNKLKPQLDALAYIKEVLFSNELNKSSKDFNIFLDKNREETIRRFKQGEIAYKETALGVCISLDTCDAHLTRSFISCIECSSSILKISKVEKTINEQQNFLKILSKDSIEYRTELIELASLEKKLSLLKRKME